MCVSPTIKSRVAHLATLVLVCLLMPGELLAEDPDNKPPPIDDILNKKHVCHPFSCSGGLVPLPTWPLRIDSYGCQSQVRQKADLDTSHVEKCCDIKNACYQLCGMAKQVCDDEFEKCMEKSCAELLGFDEVELEEMSEEEIESAKEKCGKTQGIVKLLSNIGGCREYDAFQRSNCECAAKDKVQQKMERVLRNFYKKYKPDAVGKVEGLLQKVDGKRSVFLRILLGLFAKYPASIKRKEREFPDPMKEEF